MAFYIFVSILTSFFLFYLVDSSGKSGSDIRFVDMDFDSQGAATVLMITLGFVWPISLPILGMYFGFSYISQWKKDNGK